MTERDTIFALSSGSPPAGIAVIRVSGPHAHEVTASLMGSLPEPRIATVRRLHSPTAEELLDEALVLRFDGPNSVTGEDLVELHCHGGRAVVEAVLTALSENDKARLAEPGEFTKRAFSNGRIDLTEAEGLADLLEAETQEQRRAALGQADGGVRRQVEQWRERIIALSAQAEVAIDYVGEEDVVDVNLSQPMSDIAQEMKEWLAGPRMEQLRRGFTVAIAGPPNAGKSSLLNALIGYDRAIVSEIEGTTRDHIDVTVRLEGSAITFIDTAGLRDTNDVVESMGIAKAGSMIEAADLTLWLGDRDQPTTAHDVVHIQSKCDLEPHRDGRLAVSARTGEGIQTLVREILAKSRSLFDGSTAIVLNERQAHLIDEAREALATFGSDMLIQAELLRAARIALDAVVGRSGFELLLDQLFGRFCLGK